MAQPITLPLAAGLETELTAQLVQPGATLVAENCYPAETGKTQVRLGSDILATVSPTVIPSGPSPPDPWQLATLEGTLVRFNRAPNPIHTWAPGPKAFVAATGLGGFGALTTFRRGPIKVDTTPVFSGTQVNDQVSVPDVGVDATADVVVEPHQITDDTGAAATVVAFVDRRTRKPVFSNRTSGNYARNARVVIHAGMAIVAYETGPGASLKVDRYDLASYTLAQSVTLGAMTANSAIDMRVGSPVAGANNVGILYRSDTGGGELRLATVDATNLSTNSTNTPRTTAGVVVVPNLGFGWLQDLGSSGKFSVMIADTTNGLRTLWDLPAPSGGFSNATATHTLDAGATAAPSGSTAGIRNLIGATNSSSSTGQYRVFYEVTAPSLPTRAQVKIVRWNGSADTSEQPFRSVGIRSKLWQHGGNVYFLAAFDGADQRTYVVVAASRSTTTAAITLSSPLAVVFPRDAAGLTEVTNAPSSAVVGPDGEIYIGATSETRVESTVVSATATGVTSRKFAAEIVRVRHPATAETEIGRPVEMLRSLFVPGGLIGQFDGSTYGTAGFAYYPPFVSATSAAGGALVPSATYRYRAVFSHIDRNGRKWRSAPSTPIVASTTGSNFQFSVTLETLRLIDRGTTDGSDGDQIELYRTQGNATEGYFLVATIDNNPLSDTLTFTDNVADTALGEQLYTDGGGVENQLLPAVSCCVEYQGRLVVAQAGTGTIWYSVEVDFDNGLIFNEALTLDVGDPTEPITGLAVYNEQLFATKAGKVYVIAGQGANALGQGATFVAREIGTGVGCGNPQSIVVADGGVWFKSSSTRAGIHRTAGGEPEYMGRGVHAYDNLTVTAAVVVKDRTEIRWYTLEGRTLIWNWTTRTWYTNTQQPCLTATAGYSGVPGVVYARASDSYILAESTAASVPAYKEGGATGTFYTGKIRSPWYQAGGVSGWARTRRLHGVGDVAAAHTARVRLYKDMNAATPIQSAAKAFDGTEKRWNWEVRPAQQKASAMAIEVEIERPAAVNITPSASDDYEGAGVWQFVNEPPGGFTSAHVGGTIAIGGTPSGNYDGTFTITATPAADKVTMTPTPAGGVASFLATSIVLTPAPTAGPGIVGVSLIPVVKDGMDKLPSTRRAT